MVQDRLEDLQQRLKKAIEEVELLENAIAIEKAERGNLHSVEKVNAIFEKAGLGKLGEQELKPMSQTLPEALENRVKEEGKWKH